MMTPRVMRSPLIHRLHELSDCERYIAPGPGNCVPMTAEIQTRGEIPGAMGALKGVVAGVRGVTVHGVVTPTASRRGDVAVLDDARQLGVIARREVRNRLHFRSLWSRRWEDRPRCLPCAQPLLQRSTIWLATAV